MNAVIWLVPLSPQMLQLLITVAGALFIVGGLIPRLRAWAVSILLFVIAYIALPPLLEPFLDIVPLWALILLLVILLLNMLCETLVLLGFFREKEGGWRKKKEETRAERRRSCLARILGGAVALPFRLSWRLLCSLFRA